MVIVPCPPGNKHGDDKQDDQEKVLVLEHIHGFQPCTVDKVPSFPRWHDPDEGHVLIIGIGKRERIYKFFFWEHLCQGNAKHGFSLSRLPDQKDVPALKRSFLDDINCFILPDYLLNDPF